jgi:hypothetical protein
MKRQNILMILLMLSWVILGFVVLSESAVKLSDTTGRSDQPAPLNNGAQGNYDSSAGPCGTTFNNTMNEKGVRHMWPMMYGYGNQGFYGGGLMMVFCWVVFIWFVVFTIMVVMKLDKIVKLLEKK